MRYTRKSLAFVCLIASPNAMAAVIATLIERKPACIGILSRASAARRTVSGTPADSRPNIRMSPGPTNPIVPMRITLLRNLVRWPAITVR